MKRLLIFLLVALLSFQSYSQSKQVEVVGFTVKDMDRSIKFYSEVLHFKKITDQEHNGEAYENLFNLFGLHVRIVRMQLGDEVIELTDYLTTGGRSIPEDQHSNDLSFQHIAIVVSDMEKAYAQLRKHNVEHVSTGPQTLPNSIAGAEGIKAFYFHDPDNHNLEIIYFPKGKGQAKWQKTHNETFLGIDHTAIGVSSTTNSHKFYSDILGVERKGDSWNKGSEQEHLNNVKNASLHITGYRTTAGPGIEFLEYLIPGPGKTYPADSRTDDIWYWQTTVIVDDVHSIFEKLKLAGYRFVSDKIVTVQNRKEKFKAFIVRDPDGHAVFIKEAGNQN